MKTSVFTFALTFYASATLLGSSMAAPLDKSPIQPTEDTKLVLAYSQLDEPPPAPRIPLKTAMLHKHKWKKHARRLHAHRSIKHKAPQLARVSAPIAQYPRPEIAVPRRLFDGPYAGFEAGAQNASGAFRAPCFRGFQPLFNRRETLLLPSAPVFGDLLAITSRSAMSLPASKLTPASPAPMAVLPAQADHSAPALA